MLRLSYTRKFDMTLQVRILYFFDGKRVVLTQGFLKKTSAVPPEEIDRAVRRMEDWLSWGG